MKRAENFAWGGFTFEKWNVLFDDFIIITFAFSAAVAAYGKKNNIEVALEQ